VEINQKKKAFVVGILIVLASVLIISQLSMGEGTYEEKGKHITVTFTNQTVYILGASENTDKIVDRLQMSTSKVRVIEDPAELSLLTGKFILLIDGDCFGDQVHYSVNDMALAVRPLIQQGVPVGLMNRSVDFFYFAIGNLPIAIPEDSVYYDGVITSSMFYELAFNPLTNCTSTYCIAGNGNIIFEDKVTALYNWGTEHLD
jgi:hypothetical protein